MSTLKFKISTLAKINKQLFGIREFIQSFQRYFLNSSMSIRTRRPGTTVISFTTEVLMGFSGAIGATLWDELHVPDDEDEEEEETLRLLFLAGRATGEGDRLSWGGFMGEGDLLLCLVLLGSGDALGEGGTATLSERATGDGVREILPEGWRLSSLKPLGDTTRMKSSILLVYFSNSSCALLPRSPSERLTTSILREVECFPWHEVWLSRRGKIIWQPVQVYASSSHS